MSPHISMASVAPSWLAAFAPEAIAAVPLSMLAAAGQSLAAAGQWLPALHWAILLAAGAGVDRLVLYASGHRKLAAAPIPVVVSSLHDGLCLRGDLPRGIGFGSCFGASDWELWELRSSQRRQTPNGGASPGGSGPKEYQGAQTAQTERTTGSTPWWEPHRFCEYSCKAVAWSGLQPSSLKNTCLHARCCSRAL